jgi:hypothetical protein
MRGAGAYEPPDIVHMHQWEHEGLERINGGLKGAE